MQEDLFTQPSVCLDQPLAAAIRPSGLNGYFGQEHLTAPDKPLGRLYSQKKLHSMILWGSAGTGKTTLAKILAGNATYTLIELSAVGSGVKDMREAFTKAKEQANMYGRKTVLLVDEIHSFNKSQQDILLPEVESGLITLVGCTTENPSFSLNNPLLSRVRVYTLKPHSIESTRIILNKAVEFARRDLTRSLDKIDIDDDAMSGIVDLSSGDARAAIGILEALLDLASTGNYCHITLQHLAEFSKFGGYDKSGDDHYNQLSALHKCIRGSDPDAALYWTARLITQGCNPNIVLRRLSAIASEDVGMADPYAMTLVESAWRAYERTGDHEGLRSIGLCAVYLANAPKSNSIYTAWKEALELAKNTINHEVPIHLRNAPTELMKELGYKDGYRYSHDEFFNYSPGQTYLPEDLVGLSLYKPTAHGREKNQKELMEYRAKLDEQYLKEINS